MGQVSIVTDSTADLPRELVEKYSITVVPLKVFFGQQVFSDGVDLSPERFFTKLQASSDLPTTSQPTPAEFVEHYRPLVDKGDSIISIHISEKLSGTLQSAQLAKQMLGYKDLELIDSRAVSVGLGMIVITAARAAKEGKAKHKILELVYKMIKSLNIYFMVDTLEYLRRGGRISMARAFWGTMLNVKPICHLQEGRIHLFEQVRGRKKALSRLVKIAQENYPGEKLHIFMAHGTDVKIMESLRPMIEERLDCVEILQNIVGPVVGTHAGPGVAGFAVCSAAKVEDRC